jgi:hypothetical protein
VPETADELKAVAASVGASWEARMKIIRRAIAVVILFLSFNLYEYGVANAQYANPQCAACRDSCVKQRVQCKGGCCSEAGGQDAGPNGCNGPKSRNAFVSCLKKCEDRDRPCWTACPC